MTRQTYYFGIADLAEARGKIDSLAFSGKDAESLAAQLQAALREPSLWERWRAMQPDPDMVDPSLGVNDPQAVVSARQVDLHCDVTVTTVLPHSIIKHRLTLLIGSSWTLRDVQSA